MKLLLWLRLTSITFPLLECFISRHVPLFDCTLITTKSGCAPRLWFNFYLKLFHGHDDFARVRSYTKLTFLYLCSEHFCPKLMARMVPILYAIIFSVCLRLVFSVLESYAASMKPASYTLPTSSSLAAHYTVIFKYFHKYAVILNFLHTPCLQANVSLQGLPNPRSACRPDRPDRVSSHTPNMQGN